MAKKVTLKKSDDTKASKKETKEAKAVVGEYKGRAVISLPLDKEGKYTFTFGASKARAIIKHIKEIGSFVASQQKDSDEDE